MRLHNNASGRLRRLVLGMTMAAALAVTLAACSSSASTAKHVTTTQPAPGASSAAAPATSAPAPAAAADPSPLSGTWSGKYSGAYSGTFTLSWRQSGSKLKGTIKLSAPPDTLPIHGTVQDGAIRFGTVGSVGITYAGSVSGSSMSGTYQVHAPSGSAGGPWSAAKSS